MQLRLVRLLQDGHFVRSGGTDLRAAHVRVICATNSDLQKAVEEQTFRRDLFLLLSKITLPLLPLRKHKEDIPQICEYLLNKLAKEFGKEAPQLSSRSAPLEAMEMAWKPARTRKLDRAHHRFWYRRSFGL